MIDNYLNIVTSEHRDKPKFISWLSTPLQMIDDMVTLLESFETNFDIDSATGIQLDIIGDKIGVTRTLKFQPSTGSATMDDATYRIVLKAKIAKNVWKGSIPEIYNSWDNLFPTSQIYINDNQDMSMSATVDTGLSPIINELVSNGYIIPKPMGVLLMTIQQGTFDFSASDTTDPATGFSDTTQVSGGTFAGFI